MHNGELIQFSSSRYYQGRGVLQKLGQEALLLGKRALIISDDQVWKKLEKYVVQPLQDSGIAWTRYPFAGLCCKLFAVEMF